MLSRPRILLVAVSVVGILAAAGVWHRFGARETPAGQPPLARLSEANLEDLRAAFNEAADAPRVVALLSPT